MVMVVTKKYKQGKIQRNQFQFQNLFHYVTSNKCDTLISFIFLCLHFENNTKNSDLGKSSRPSSSTPCLLKWQSHRTWKPKRHARKWWYHIDVSFRLSSPVRFNCYLDHSSAEALCRINQTLEKQQPNHHFLLFPSLIPPSDEDERR